MEGLPIIIYAVASYWAASKTLYAKSPSPRNMGELGARCGIAMALGWLLIPIMVIKQVFSEKESTAPQDTSKSSDNSDKPALVDVNPISSTVLVNGVNTSFDAYNISGANYFKLRDLACVLSGTEKQFDVSWDFTSNIMILTSGHSYTAVGGEMAPSGGPAQTTIGSHIVKVLVDGKKVSLSAHMIGETNYFKLRDIGKLFDFGISWDKDTKTISIDTSTGYTAK